MNDRPEIAAFVDAAAAMLDLSLAPASRDGVIQNMGLLLERAADFLGAPLDDDLDPAALLRL